MKFTNSFSRDLGVFTWAGLQSAYANGGGALAALPTGTTAFVSDWGAQFTPNAAKTYWKPSNGYVSISGQVAALSTYLAQLTGSGALQKFVPPVTPTIPANLLQIGCRLYVAYLAKRTTLATTPGAANVHVHIGTTDSTSDQNLGAVNVAATLNMSIVLEAPFEIVASNTIRYYNTAARNYATVSSSNISDATSNINLAAQQYVNIVIGTGFVSGAASDVVQLNELHVWALFP